MAHHMRDETTWEEVMKNMEKNFLNWYKRVYHEDADLSDLKVAELYRAWKAGRLGE